MIKNNLVLLGVSSSWQRAAVGVLLIIGITIQAIGENQKQKRQRSATNKEAE
jgi:simple sugar transport system permease protein